MFLKGLGLKIHLCHDVDYDDVSKAAGARLSGSESHVYVFIIDALT